MKLLTHISSRITRHLRRAFASMVVAIASFRHPRSSRGSKQQTTYKNIRHSRVNGNPEKNNKQSYSLRSFAATCCALLLFISSIQPTLAAYNPSGWVNYGGSTTADVTAAVATPTTLGASAITTTTVTLTWVDNSANETSYRIERAPDSSGTPGTFTEIGNTVADATTYTDTGLTASTTYWYRVRATSGGGNSAYTSNISTTTAVATLTPTTTNIGYTSTPVTPTSTTLSNFTTTAFTSGNNTSVGTADGSTLATTASGTTGSGTASVPFTTSGNYTYDNMKVDVTGGVGKLKSTGTTPATQAFSYTGADQTWNVPAGVSSATVFMWGAGGAGSKNASGTPTHGGAGGYVSGSLSVTPGESLTIKVGQGGIIISASNNPSAWPNGGRPYDIYGGAAEQAGGGGGRSAILRGGTELATAGAGGGAVGYNPSGGHGGDGGGSNGGDGVKTGGSGVAGLGGTQSAGGAGGGGNAESGSFHKGGNGSTAGDGSAGGGDGYYGGGGGYSGANQTGPGGGGSSYVGGLTSATTTAGSGGVPANTGSPYYAAGVAVGGIRTNPINGGDGRVVVSYGIPSYTTSTLYTFTTSTAQLSTATWSGITSVAVTETKPTNTAIYYATSFDNRSTFAVNTTGAWRQIARNNAGTWQYNSNTTYGSTTWTACTTNTQNDCLSQAFGVTQNQMTGTQMAAIADADWETSGGYVGGVQTIDVATGLTTTSSTATPSVDNIQFTYTTGPRHAAQLFTYNTSAYSVTSLAPTLIAYATAQAGNGLTAKIWNANTLAWDSLASLANTSASMPTTPAAQTISASVANYIDSSGIVRVLTYSDNPSTAGTSAVLTTDLSALAVWGTVNPPATPTGLTATFSNTGFTAATLTWTDASTNETNYTVERSTDNTNWTTLSSTLAANTNSYADSGLSLATTYYYRVRATNSVTSGSNATLTVSTPVTILTPSTAHIGYTSTPTDPTSTTLSTFTSTTFTSGNNTSTSTDDTDYLATTASGSTSSGTASIPYTTAGNYSIQDSNSAEVSTGVAQLKGTAGSSPVQYSARFNGTNADLTRNFPSNGTRTTWTFSTWVKLGGLTVPSSGELLLSGTSGGNDYFWFEPGANADKLNYYDASSGTNIRTNAVYRDLSTWYHVVLAINTNAAANDRAIIYINGQRQSLLTNTQPGAGSSTYFNSSGTNYIGWLAAWTNNQFKGYLADTYFVDGQALDPTSFAQSDANGQWVPKSYSGTYGTNGFHLNFANSSAMGTDVSGQGNTWTANNIATTDQMLDTPTNNYPTWNPLDVYSSLAVSLVNGNLTQASYVNSGYMIATMSVPSTGKWYWEVTMDNIVTSPAVGVATSAGAASTNVVANSVYYYRGTGNIWLDGSSPGSAYGSSWTTGQTVAVAFDADNNKLFFGIIPAGGGAITWQNSGNPSTGANPVTGTSLSGKTWFPSVTQSGTGTTQITGNFGQSTWKGNNIPTGFKALSTANLPTPAITKPNQYFDVVTYTGNGSTQNITGLQFQPDFVWIKGLNQGTSHSLMDSVRGTSVGGLSTNSTNGENTGLERLSSFNSNGFGVMFNNGGQANTSAYNYVAWAWKKGALPGFDVQTFTTPASAVATTQAHNLGAVPAMVIVKQRNSTDVWGIWHKSFANPTSDTLRFTTGAVMNYPGAWGAGMTSSAMGYTPNAFNLNLSSPAVAYLWSEVPGFSKFGSYIGNGSNNGPFVYTGFKPRFILLKSLRGGVSDYWYLMDTARMAVNPMVNGLHAHDALAEGVGDFAYGMDVLSNGFKIRDLASSINYNTSTTYIYAAFAEAPLQPTNLTTYTANATTLVTTAADQLSTTTWSGITSVAVTETKPTNTSIYYATSFDGRVTFSVNTTGSWRQIARNNAGTWQYNSNTTYGSTTWAACTTNTQNDCLSQAFGVSANQMTGTQLAAITTGNWTATNGWTPGNTIDIATGLTTTDATQTPSVDNIQFTYATAPRYAANLFTYNTSAYSVTSIAPQLLAYATANAGNGLTTKIWNANTLAWDALTSLNNTSATLPATTSAQTISASVSNYIDSNGIVRVLTYSNNPSTGATSAVLTTDYAGLPLWGTLTNQSPNTPTLVAPANAAAVNTATPTLSATYSDPDASDIGTTEYRIATGSTTNCVANTNVVASGTSSTTAATASNVTSTTTWTPGSAIGADATYYWCARNNDSVATSAWTAMGSFTVDTANPTLPAISYTNAYLNTTSQSVTFSSTDVGGSGIASYTLYRNTGTLSAGSCSSYAGWVSLGTQTSPYTDSTLQSAKCYQYYVTATDNAGNTSSSTSSPTDVTKVDTQNPNVGTAPTITDTDSGSTTWTNALTVAVSAFASSDTLSGIWKYLINESSTTPLTGDVSWVTTAPTTYILQNATNGAKTVYFWVMDLAGNVSSYVSGGISLDTVAPSSTSISLNSAASYTTSSTLTLTLAASDPGGSGVVQMQFSCDNTTYTTPESYNTTKSFALSSYAAAGCTTGDGTKTVYVKFIDTAGNISTQVNDSITLDTTAPSLTITDNANGSWNTSDTIVATETELNPQTLKWEYDADGTCPTIAGSYANTYTSGTTLTVSTTHTDYMCFISIDAAGNTSTTATNALKVDTTAPTAPTMTVESAYTAGTSNTVATSAVTDANSGSVTYEFCQNTSNTTTGCTSAGWNAATSATFNTLTDGQTYYYFVRARDVVNNTTSWSASTSSTQDATAPTIQTTTLTSPNGGESYGGTTTHAITWNPATITDTGAGVGSLTLAYTTDGTNYTVLATGEANDGTYTWTTPDLTSSTVKVRLTAVDTLGNANTTGDTSDAVFTITSTTTATRLTRFVSSDNQLVDMNTTAPHELGVTVDNGFGTPVSGTVVTFTITSTPTAPTAVNQALTNGTYGTLFGGSGTTKTVTSDASGLASVTFTSGNRAGNYTVTATIGDGTGNKTVTFTLVERELFQVTLGTTNANLALDPSTTASSTAANTITVTTNAASWNLVTTPSALPTSGTANTITNFLVNLGFGWNIDGGATQSFLGGATPTTTTVYTCATADATCHPSNGITTKTFGLGAAINYLTPAGTYSNINTVQGANVSF